MSLCPPFYCSKCGTTHADECPPKPDDSLHDWQFQAPVVDLNNMYTCRRCKKVLKRTLMRVFMEGAPDRHGCPGRVLTFGEKLEELLDAIGPIKPTQLKNGCQLDVVDDDSDP